MTEDLRRKIRILSKMLKWMCIGAIFLVPMLTAFPWIVKNFLSHFLAIYLMNGAAKPYWCSSLITSPLMRGMAVDMVRCAFLVAPLVVLMKLFKQYERCIFFSRKNISYLRWIAGLLILQMIFFPLYLILTNFNYDALGQVYPLVLYSLNDFKMWILILSLFLLAYITEMGFNLEEEYKLVI